MRIAGGSRNILPINKRQERQILMLFSGVALKSSGGYGDVPYAFGGKPSFAAM